MSKTITALFDGDWLLYAAGFAGQKNELICPKLTGTEVFSTMTQLKEAANTKELDEPVFSRFILDPDSHFFHSAKKMIEGNCQKIQDKLGREVRVAMLIDGDGNFRNRIATIVPYKGTRSVHAKPIKYNDIRQYLLDSWDAEIVLDQETDDEMAIRQTASDDTIIVSIDKDMLQVPGWHLNPNKGFKKVGPAEGLVRLYRQAAMGDTVDNIKGAYKVGAAAAKKLFPAGGNVYEPDMWKHLVLCYERSIEKYGNKYGGLSAEEAALENMRLVYLRRKRDELWLPPSER